ncbi:zinc finger protein 454-like [Dendronephthya gigantea]|uniref:zinc finger protein 454-like n=1 Tax=Dendronephthya gigantea TaxID=151771 RepID=UPI00106BDC18|nr:zinc finger protein 454-like [Dendronephthya gigantea]
MTENLSVIWGRPSVIKWAGKDFAPDIISKKEDLDSTTVGSVQAYEISQPVQKGKNSDQSFKQTTKNSESLFLKSTDAEKKYGCEICKKRFKWRSHWKSHERIHTGERPFQCEICAKRFTRSDGLQCHKKVHIKIGKPRSSETQPQASYLLSNSVIEGVGCLKQDKVFICAYCGRTFGSLRGYCRHTDKKHKDKDDLKCHICNTIFNRPSALKIHNRVHTGLKPYHCNICSKSFSIRGNLKRHLFIHSGERPYSCRYCSSCFNTSSHLTRHIKSKHKNYLN